MSEAVSAKEGRDDRPTFIHSELDDYGLTPIEFRVYGRLARRAGRGEATESIPHMAEGCKTSVRSVQLALRLLEKAQLIDGSDRTGKSTVYTLLSRARWLAANKLDALRAEVTKNWKHTPATLAPPQTPAPIAPDPCNPCTTTPATLAPKGSPIEGTPLKETVPNGTGATANAARSKTKVSKSQKVSTADPRSKHPAVQIVRTAIGHYPKLILYDKIIKLLGPHPDGPKVIACATECASRGWNVENLNTWLFDWYANGIPERNDNGTNRQNGNSHRNSTKPPVTRDFSKYPARS